ncbi:MAG: DUF481 domain-containing protein [Filimonas sp.]|nr:DUF481 domain-containing protein [Filimonas sp.]
MQLIKIVLLALLTSPCIAQFNDSTHYYFRYVTTGVVNKTDDGNSYVLNNGLTFNINKKKVTINSNASWVYGVQNNDLTNNDFSAVADVDYLKNTQKLYYWGLVGYDNSFSLKINHRLQMGAGIGYTFVNTKTLNFVLSDGFLFETADLIDNKLGHDVYNTVRNTLRIKYKWEIKDLLVFDGSDFVQPSITSINDYVLRFTNNFSIKLKEWLRLTASLNYNKVNRTDHENLLLTFGATIEKYF